MKNVNVSISLLCPICGNDQFKYDEESESPAKCADCGHESSRYELISDNSEQINSGVEEVTDEVKKQLEEQLFKSLQNAFKGNKNFKIKRGR